MRTIARLASCLVLLAVGCRDRSGITVGDGGVPGDDLATIVNPATGPCHLVVEHGNDVYADGWCLQSPGALAIDPASVTAVAAPGLVRIDKATGAQTILAGAGGTPRLDGALADGGDELFFSAVGADGMNAIFAVPRGGGQVRTVVATGATIPQYDRVWSIALDASNVYWLAGGVWSAPRAGGGTPARVGGAVAVSASIGDPSLVVGADALYYTRPGAGEIDRQPLDGSPASVVATGRTPGPLVVAGDTIYWIEVGTPGADCSPTDGALRSWSPSGGAKTWASGLAGARDLTLAGGGVVWTEAGAVCNIQPPIGTVQSVSAPAAAPSKIADGQLLPQAIVSDGTNLYWVIVSAYDNNGAIVHAPLP